jgi:hypothetical protein
MVNEKAVSESLSRAKDELVTLRLRLAVADA